MRIAYDVRPFLKDETGVGVYLKNLLFALAQADKTNEYYLLSSSFKDRFQPEKIPSFSRMSFRDFRFPTKIVDFAWYSIKWPPLDTIFRTTLDLTHSATPLILPTKGKKIITICDLFFLDFPSLTGKEARTYFSRKLASSLQQADGIVSISHFIKKQLLQRFLLPEEKVRVIHLGVDTQMKKPLSKTHIEQIKQKLSLPPSFLLFIGTIEPRKNLAALIDALKILHRSHKENIPLIIAGHKGQGTPRLLDKIKETGLESCIRLIGYVSDAEKQALYQLASVLVFPSLCEGFGLPLLEAMANSLPVAASKGSAFSEVGKDAVSYFDPKNPEDIASSILSVLKNSTLRKKMVERGKKRAGEFDWRKTALQTLRLYKDVMEKRIR